MEDSITITDNRSGESFEIPIVDGGMFLYLVYEKIRGVPPSVGFQNAAMLVGFVLILTAFVVTFFNDIGRLIG